MSSSPSSGSAGDALIIRKFYDYDKYIHASAYLSLFSRSVLLFNMLML